jgi:Na+/melibiose symporter-like transporter
MQDTELFLSMAEIAGVFVGFGALIAVRSGGPVEASEVTGIRWVMSNAIWVVIAALIPILVSGYGVSSHELWLLCSLLALVLLVVMIVVNGRAPENLAEIAAARASMPRATRVVLFGPTIWLPMVLLVLALALVAFGPFPNQEQALYLTAVGLGLYMGAMALFGMVFEQRPAQTASDPAELPATGGSSG